MSGSRLERRGFLTLVASVLAGGGFLAIGRPTPVPAREPDPDVFSGQGTFERLMELASERRWTELPIGERIGAIGMALRQTPYVAASLELFDDREVCSVNLQGLDCVTFFESALGVARMLRRGGGRTPDALLAEVTFTRYRGGRLTDYVSRLHYLSDWFFDNARKGVVRPITRELPGAQRAARRIDYMSTHPEAYRQLRANPDLVRRIAQIEAEISARGIEYVPKERVAEVQPLLVTGDIVGVTTAIDGLDCAHSGLCYRDEGGRPRFLHASTTAQAVLLDDELATYLARVSTHTGIMVARPLEVT